MTAATGSRRSVVAGACALLAALVLALLPLPSATTSAAAADSSAEDSAVTVTGKQGKYDDFSRLKVTVHQTKNLRSQGVRVSWAGGAPTSSGNFSYDYLQIMQCWGDGPAGPDRNQCVFGETDTSDSVVPGAFATSRRVDAAGGGFTSDPGETQYTGANAFVPFRPVGGLPPTTSVKDPTYFGPLDTNEQVANRTFADGTGEVTFEVQDALEAPHLGCGANTAPTGSTPVPRSCWLVVVPRGTHDTDGTDVTNPGGTRNHNLYTSPLSATNWAQRMVVRLDFLPSEAYCPTGQTERPTAGSELVTDAVTSWQPKLCSSTGSTFAFTQGGEEEARNQVLGTTADSPLLGFTVDPVTRPEDGAEVVQAPVAVSGVTVAFFIEGPSGVVQGMKLSPRLVAKMLTHSYVNDVTLGAVPDYLKGNSSALNEDPEFKQLNPGFPELRSRQLRSLMVPLQDADTTRIVWNWLQSDKDAREFLSGTKDPWGMQVNRYFKDLNLATATSLTDYPKVDPTTTPAIGNGTPALNYAITDLDPYTADMHDGALKTRRGNNNRTIQWQPGDTQSPARLINDAPYSGQRAVMAIVDTASAVRYGLITAALRNADGNYVKPTAATLAADVATMQPSSEDATVLKPDPARAKGQAYPLTAVAYAAASVNQDATARTAYARFIRYVSGSNGQTLGLSAGQLPFGYAPLPAKQRQQAATAADTLERGVTVSESQSEGSTAAGTAGDTSGGGTGTGGTSGGAAAGGAAAGGGTGGSSPSASAAANVSTPPSSGPQQNVANAKEGFTPGEVLGIIRWILLGVLFLGGAAGLSGPVMLHLGRRRTP
ncbi:hypothetical protein [Streptomyces hokutonensis]|uniref:hypothetical protein n=1 Tax=Streptomyces hokutonensis TaxID=1306990 RepID=UPI0036BD4255